MTAVAFVAAAMLGAVARSAVGRGVSRTLLVNVVGSFVLGVLTGLALYHGLGHASRTVLGTGFCGAFTTFSTFSVEAVQLVEGGDAEAALRYVGLSLLLGGAAAAAGVAVMAV